MWPNPQFPVDMVTFIEEIFNGKLHFSRSNIRLYSFIWEELIFALWLIFYQKTVVFTLLG